MAPLMYDPEDANLVGGPPGLEGPRAELAKHTSAGKPQVQDIDPLFILAMGDVLTQGLTKYPNDEDGMPNWWKGGDYRDFVGSIQRHASRLASGEELDDESGQPHAAHIAVDAMFIWSWMSRGVGWDTRLVTPQTLDALFNSALERGRRVGRLETSRFDSSEERPSAVRRETH